MLRGIGGAVGGGDLYVYVSFRSGELTQDDYCRTILASSR